MRPVPNGIWKAFASQVITVVPRSFSSLYGKILVWIVLACFTGMHTFNRPVRTWQCICAYVHACVHRSPPEVIILSNAWCGKCANSCEDAYVWVRMFCGHTFHAAHRMRARARGTLHLMHAVVHGWKSQQICTSFLFSRLQLKTFRRLLRLEFFPLASERIDKWDEDLAIVQQFCLHRPVYYLALVCSKSAASASLMVKKSDMRSLLGSVTKSTTFLWAKTQCVFPSLQVENES